MQQWQNKFISSYTIVVYNRFGWTGNKLPWFCLYCSYKIEYLEIDYTYAENRNAIRTLFSIFPKLKHFKSSVPRSDTFWKNIIREESRIKISVNEFSGSKNGWNIVPDIEEVLAMVWTGWKVYGELLLFLKICDLSRSKWNSQLIFTCHRS